MPTVTSRRAKPSAKILARVRALAEERVKIERKRKPDEGRIAEIEAELKKLATETGETFKEYFGKDWLSASGAVAAESKGEQPILQTEVWLALTEIERKRLVKSGLVAIEPQWGRASGGRVTVKVY